MIKFRIFRFDYQEETVAGRQREIRRVENRMVRLRQLVKRQHAQHRRERRRQYGAFKGDRNEGRPTVEGLAADNDWIVDHFHPVLHEKSAQRADDPADQDD